MIEELNGAGFRLSTESIADKGLPAVPRTARPGLTRWIGDLAGRTSFRLNTVAINHLHWQFGPEQHQQLFALAVMGAVGFQKVATIFHGASNWMETPLQPSGYTDDTDMDEQCSTC